MSDVFVLGIESSCDETAAAVVVNGRNVLSNVIFSQIDIHKKYGGVVPEIASRNHTAKIDSVVMDALSVAGLSLNEIHVVAATNGPGLVGALLVGLSFGKALSYANELPFIGAHHIEGHICANYLENDDFKPPFMCLVVSGGHTHLLHVIDYGKYEILGKTRDDAAGEAYDKVARAIGLPYPGGIEIDKLAKLGNPNAIKFPKALIGGEQLDFSFSGIKSAVLNYINSCEMTKTVYKKEDLAASFQKAVVETLVQKAVLACRQRSCKTFALAGGVASNSELRKQMTDACEKEGIMFHVPPAIYCTDNAAMIASTGYFSFIAGKRDDLSLNAYPNLALV